MTIEELLEQLESEKNILEKRYGGFYDRLVEIRKEIKAYYTDMFLSPEHIPLELERELAYCDLEYTEAFVKCNDIRTAINIIKERVG